MTDEQVLAFSSILRALVVSLEKEKKVFEHLDHLVPDLLKDGHQEAAQIIEGFQNGFSRREPVVDNPLARADVGIQPRSVRPKT